ncbi:PAS domain-containing sensor histidine kinase [uncultured Cytophaga sp.]|uniref:PAS domain-containing sensor histidine kinase n=1 Tax=uncultured Cytophaga sp. TaxID=160238 RepID=UPI002617570E|nr:PAS domain-containing sensor histidine kinase [uncultured Cytophaga sp.]
MEDLNEEINRLKLIIEGYEKKTQLNIDKLFLESSLDIIFQLDLNANIIFSHFPSVPSEQLDKYKGMNIFDIAPPSMKEQLKNVLDTVFATGETCVYEAEGEVSSGYKYFLNHMSAIKNQLGEVQYAYFVGRETTSQVLANKEAIKSEQKLSALFEGSSQIISLFDKESQFIWFNRASYDKSIFLFGKFIALGERFDAYLKEENREEFNENFKKVLQGEIISYTREYIYKDKPFILDIMLQPVYRKGELVGVSLIGNDDTERKEYESKLEKANSELLQQNEQLNQYSYIISHNLRAPIVTLMGLLNLLGNDYESVSDKNEIVSHMTKSANHLDSVIKDLNHLLSISDIKSALAPIDLGDEFETVLFLLEAEIKQTNPTISVDFSKHAVALSLKSFIHNILYNLVSNALKYHQAGKVPNISIKSYGITERLMCIEVADKGIGIDLEKYKDKLFGFYKRFHFHVEGKGLGLHLVKRQVDSLGGRIEVESEVGVGTIFKVLLPI